MSMHHTAEEKIEISKKICEAYANEVVTIDSCIENQGISARTFIYWCEEIAEIAEMYKAAQLQQSEKYKRNLKAKCLSSLEKLVNGFEADDVEQTDVPIYEKDADGKLVRVGVKTTSIRRTKKKYAPNVTSIIFALKALDPSTYKDNLPPAEQNEQTFLIGGKEIKF